MAPGHGWFSHCPMSSAPRPWDGCFSARTRARGWSGNIPARQAAASIDLLRLAAVCVFGFMLCPYLDLTFHRARQGTSVYGAIASFTIGFGALFLAMIVFTLWYAPLVLPPGATRGATV